MSGVCTAVTCVAFDTGDAGVACNGDADVAVAAVFDADCDTSCARTGDARSCFTSSARAWPLLCTGDVDARFNACCVAVAAVAAVVAVVVVVMGNDTGDTA